MSQQHVTSCIIISDGTHCTGRCWSDRWEWAWWRWWWRGLCRPPTSLPQFEALLERLTISRWGSSCRGERAQRRVLLNLEGFRMFTLWLKVTVADYMEVQKMWDGGQCLKEFKMWTGKVENLEKSQLYSWAVVAQTCRKVVWTGSLSSSENLSRCLQTPGSPRSQLQSKSATDTILSV